MPLRLSDLRNFIVNSRTNGFDQGAAQIPFEEALFDGMEARFVRPQRDGALDAAAHILGPNVTNRRILMVAEPSSPLHEHIGWLDRHTRGVYCFGTLDDAEAAAATSPVGTLTLVSLDMCFNLNVAFDMLSAHRLRAPQRVTIIASQMFAQHDMSCERASIADASLRLPASRAELALCLGAAVTNNDYLQSRRRLV